MRKDNGTVVNWKKDLDVCLGIDRVMITMLNLRIYRYRYSMRKEYSLSFFTVCQELSTVPGI